MGGVVALRDLKHLDFPLNAKGKTMNSELMPKLKEFDGGKT